MLPNLTIIISIYCCIRLMEMISSNAVPKLKAPWALLCVAAIAIIGFFCFVTVRRGGPKPTIPAFGASSVLSGQRDSLDELFKDVDTVLAAMILIRRRFS